MGRLICERQDAKKALCKKYKERGVEVVEKKTVPNPNTVNRLPLDACGKTRRANPRFVMIDFI